MKDYRDSNLSGSRMVAYMRLKLTTFSNIVNPTMLWSTIGSQPQMMTMIAAIHARVLAQVCRRWMRRSVVRLQLRTHLCENSSLMILASDQNIPSSTSPLTIIDSRRLCT